MASIGETAAALRRRSISCVQLVRACLERIEAVQPELNAFITVTAEQALSRSETLDAELAAGKDRGPLHGIPIVHKDLFDTAGVRTTAGSRLFASRIPDRDATVVRRLADAGAVMLGKTNMNELAAGTSGRNVHYGDVLNPLNPKYSAGGSSSGTAAAIAAGLCLAGTGSDTGGSIRIPAACTGLVGLRPGFGRLPLEGVTLRSRSLDTAGPMARTVDDCALLFAAMAAAPPPPATMRAAAARIAVPEGVPAELGVAETLVGALAAAGVRPSVIRLAELFSEESLAAVMDLMLYEFHDLMRGHLGDPTLFGPVVLANLERGSRITENRYRQCLQRAESLSRMIRSVVQDVDALALPVLAAPTPLLEAPASVYDAQRLLTLPLSATRLPVIAVPCGRDADGMPLGMQLVGRDGAEERLFSIGKLFERRGE
jgi:aspartyl-tRNA(Asn)/glutamyl-tRNA(Gln) amidotransferase subunit A